MEFLEDNLGIMIPVMLPCHGSAKICLDDFDQDRKKHIVAPQKFVTHRDQLCWACNLDHSLVKSESILLGLTRLSNNLSCSLKWRGNWVAVPLQVSVNFRLVMYLISLIISWQDRAELGWYSWSSLRINWAS